MTKRAPLIFALTLVGAVVGLVVSRNPLVVAGLAVVGGLAGLVIPTKALAGAGAQLGFADYAWRLIPANPILLRVVESGGKRRRDLFIRCGYLGLLVFVVIFSLMSSGSSVAGGTDLSALAKESAAIFARMSYLQLALVALLAPIFTAGAITQEKDSQTYDILLATPLSNGQIVLGSLLSRLFFVVALLVSGIPVFSITQIFGGVAISSIVKSFGIAAATAFVTGALAMAIAVFKVGTRRTIFSFYLFIVIYLVGGYLLDQAPFFKIRLADGTLSTTSWLTGLHPFLALEVIFNKPSYTPPDILALPAHLQGRILGTYLSKPTQFYTTFMFALSFLLVMPSIVLLRRLAQSTTSFKGAILQKLKLSRGDRTRKPRYVWANPIAWREARTKASAARATFMRYGFMAAGLIGALVLVWKFSTTIEPKHFVDATSFDATAGTLTVFSSVEEPLTLRVPRDVNVTHNGKPGNLDDLRGRLAVVATPRNATPDGKGARVWATVAASELPRVMSASESRQWLLGMVIVEFAVILLIVTNAAASTVTRKKEDGTLDILLTSPITSRYYIWGKLRGLVSFVLPLIMVPVASVLVFVLYDLFRRTAYWDDPAFQWIVLPEAVLMMPAMLVIVSEFAAIVGMQMSLRCRTTVMAVMSSVGIVVGVCGALGWCGYGVLGSGNNELGLVIGSFSPFTVLMLLIDPYQFAGGLFGTNQPGVDNSTVSRGLMFAFTFIAVGAYTGIVWSMYRSMVKNFDMTIRRQSR